jgi:hypothetical protein
LYLSVHCNDSILKFLQIILPECDIAFITLYSMHQILQLMTITINILIWIMAKGIA